MTTSRVIRGTRAKIFFYLCSILVIVGIIACYNNTLSQLEDVKKANDVCHQQEENLSTQLQVISDYKQRLEKSLKTEKAEHQRTKNSLETQLKDERSKNEKDSTDSKMKLASLQQHFNLLQTEYEDFKEESSKNQKTQQEIVNDLEAKLNELKEELKKIKVSKEGLKSRYIELQIERDRIKKEAQENLGNKGDEQNNINKLSKENAELKIDLENLKANCPCQDTLPQPKAAVEISSSRNFNKMSPISSEVYQINKNMPDPNPDRQEMNQNVLAAPNTDNLKAPSSSAPTKTGAKPSQANLSAVKPLQGPGVTPETVARNEVLKVPNGVVPLPEIKEKDHHVEDARYQNARDSANSQDAAKAAVKEDPEKDNVAHEVFDSPLAQNNGDDALVFGDNAKNNNIPPPPEKKHIDALGNEQADYKDLQNDAQLEENEEDDDADEYGDRRQKEPAVRN